MSRQQISYFSEYAKRHEIARVETKSHFSEYAVRHEIARAETTALLRVRGETRDRTCQNTTRTAPGVRG